MKKIFYYGFLILSSFIMVAATDAPVSIILVHGVLNNAHGMRTLAEKIKIHHPTAYVKTVNLGFGKWTSFFNIFDQAEWLKMELENDPNIGNSCIMIGHSQGGLIARYYVQRYNTPQVTTLITLGAPHQGIFGMPGNVDQRFAWLNILELHAYKLFYLHPIQKYISVASYWKDPFNMTQYLSDCHFLPHANNEIDHPFNAYYKENIERLEKFVLVNSVKEETMIPSETCHFGFYQKGTLDKIEPFIETDQWNFNLLGLQTLFSQKKLIFKQAACTHADYLTDENNFLYNILPYLT